MGPLPPPTTRPAEPTVPREAQRARFGKVPLGLYKGSSHYWKGASKLGVLRSGERPICHARHVMIAAFASAQVTEADASGEDNYEGSCRQRMLLRRREMPLVARGNLAHAARPGHAHCPGENGLARWRNVGAARWVQRTKGRTERGGGAPARCRAEGGVGTGCGSGAMGGLWHRTLMAGGPGPTRD